MNHGSEIFLEYHCATNISAIRSFLLTSPGNLEMVFTLQPAFLGGRVSLVSILVQVIAATVIIRILLNVRQQNFYLFPTCAC